MTSQFRPDGRYLRSIAKHYRALADDGIQVAFCVGAQRAGTSSLYSALQAYTGKSAPVAPRTKEPGLFTLRSGNHVFLRRYFDEVRDYAESREFQRLLDFSTTYSQVLTYPWVPELVGALCSEARVMVVWRDPVDRSVSAAIERLSHTRSGGANSVAELIPNLVDGSLMARTAEVYADVLGRDRVHLIRYPADVATHAAQISACFGITEGLGSLPKEYARSTLVRPNNGLRRLTTSHRLRLPLQFVADSKAGPVARKLARYGSGRTFSAHEIGLIESEVKRLLRPYEDIFDAERESATSLV